MDTSNICFELSEKHQVGMYAGVDKLVLNLYEQQGYKMAIDDFGVGFSGLQMLFNADPNFIKIDRFFISDIHLSKKKKTLRQLHRPNRASDGNFYHCRGRGVRRWVRRV